jgi:hypothetical protein
MKNMDWSGFFPNLLGVVLGILLTVGMGLLISNRNDRKDQKQYLDAIKIELEENAKMFDYCTKWLQKSCRYADYITSTDRNSLNRDTIDYYSMTDDDGCGYSYTLSVSALFPTNAFEMYKSSGAMRQIEDKKLLMSMWNVYTQIESAKLNMDRYFRIKEDEHVKMIQLSVEGKMGEGYIPMQIFYSSGIPGEMVRWAAQTSKVIKEMLLKFE